MDEDYQIQNLLQWARGDMEQTHPPFDTTVKRLAHLYVNALAENRELRTTLRVIARIVLDKTGKLDA